MRVGSIGLALLSAAWAYGVSAPPAAAFSAQFSWRGIPACRSVSPAFRLSGVPSGTVALALSMRDQEAPEFDHGGSTVRYAGHGVVPKGAITYTGPCPPTGERHRYVWTVDALDAQGATIDTTEAKGDFPP